MKKLGEVKAILNEQLLIITSTQLLNPGETVTVFSEIADSRVAEATGIHSIAYPKGELRVVCPQEKHTYLVERFRELTEKKRTITVPSPFQKAVMGLAAQLQPETKEIVEQVPGPWSADLDKDDAIGLSIARTVKVGDPVGRMT